VPKNRRYHSMHAWTRRKNFLPLHLRLRLLFLLCLLCSRSRLPNFVLFRDTRTHPVSIHPPRPRPLYVHSSTIETSRRIGKPQRFGFFAVYRKSKTQLKIAIYLRGRLNSRLRYIQPTSKGKVLERIEYVFSLSRPQKGDCSAHCLASPLADSSRLSTLLLYYN